MILSHLSPSVRRAAEVILAFGSLLVIKALAQGGQSGVKYKRQTDVPYPEKDFRQARRIVMDSAYGPGGFRDGRGSRFALETVWPRIPLTVVTNLNQ